MKNILKIIILITLSLGLISCEEPSPDQVLKNLPAKQFIANYKKDLQNNHAPVLLDIRTPQEFRQGHLPKAVNIDFYASGFAKELKKLDRSGVYYIYCRSGNRTGQTLRMMGQLGFKEVYNLSAGIISL